LRRPGDGEIGKRKHKEKKNPELGTQDLLLRNWGGKNRQVGSKRVKTPSTSYKKGESNKTGGEGDFVFQDRLFLLKQTGVVEA